MWRRTARRQRVAAWVTPGRSLSAMLPGRRAPRFSIVTPGARPAAAAAARRASRRSPARRSATGSCASSTTDRPSRGAGRAAPLPWPPTRACTSWNARSPAGSSPRPMTALAMATGEFVVLVDHDDRLDPDALGAGRRRAPRRPARSTTCTPTRTSSPPTARSTTRSTSRTGHRSGCGRRTTAPTSPCCGARWSRRSAGFRDGFDGSQDHDLILRVTERARRVHHVPEVLYHWCVTPGSAAGRRRTPSRTPRRPGGGPSPSRWRASASRPPSSTWRRPGHFRVRRALPEPPPTASVVIPTVGHGPAGVGGRARAGAPGRAVAARRDRRTPTSRSSSSSIRPRRRRRRRAAVASTSGRRRARARSTTPRAATRASPRRRASTSSCSTTTRSSSSRTGST